MERGGGFHSYRKLPSTTPGLKQAGEDQIEMSTKQLPELLNHTNTNTNSNSSSSTDVDNECTVREQDRFMPIANVIRIMRKILPPHAKISDDAKETIQECVSEYISFITGEANERCQREQRKTITAEDVLWAMSKLGFDDYIEPLTMYLHRYREMEGERAGCIRGEPLPKRSLEYHYGSLSLGFAAAFAPSAFHPQHPATAFFGGSGRHLKDASSNAATAAGSSHAALTNGEAYVNTQHK